MLVPAWIKLKLCLIIARFVYFVYDGAATTSNLTTRCDFHCASKDALVQIAVHLWTSRARIDWCKTWLDSAKKYDE